jgi:hypothetical protein
MTNPNTTETTETQIIATRAVHRALAASVELQGIDQARALYAAAREFNAAYFAGSLLPVAVMIAAPASPRALATHEHRTPEGVDSLVKIAPSVVDASALLALDVLLHEMVHIACHEQGDDEPGYQGHGPVFAAKCNAIGAVLGLAPVGVKGRDGLPDCAQWPLNVRPEGFYGEAPLAAKAWARSNKRPAPRPARKPAKKAAKRIDWKKVAKALAKKYRHAFR